MLVASAALVIGVPLGIAAGRGAWLAMADGLHVELTSGLRDITPERMTTRTARSVSRLSSKGATAQIARFPSHASCSAISTRFIAIGRLRTILILPASAYGHGAVLPHGGR